jgi:hypothetical protein
MKLLVQFVFYPEFVHARDMAKITVKTSVIVNISCMRSDGLG